jgi:hypothetical protein
LFQDLPLPAPGNSIRSADIGSLGRESFVVGGRNAAVLSTVRYDDGLGTYVAELSGGSSGPQENISIVLSSPEHQPRRAVFSFNDTGALRILTNNPLGSGSFEQSTPIPGAFVDLQLVTFADLRGDGNQYVVACNNDRLITIDPGPQTDFAQAGLYEPIAYTPSQLVPMPSRQGSYLAAVTGAVGLRIIHVGPDAAGWSIRTEAAVNVVGATNQPRWAVIDINGDGRDDILHIVNVNLNHRVRWQLQLPNGTFQAPVERFVSTTPITNLVASDLNSDAYGDAVVLQANGQASILYGQADGELSEPQPVPLSPFGNPGSLILADLDQDGLIDLACANRSNSSGSAAVHVAYATGPESYAPPVAFSAPTMSGSTTGGMIDAGDLNDDGVLDIALATNNGGAYVLLSNGPRSYQSPLLATVIANLTGIRIVDMGGDGLAELVVSASDRSVILSREDSDLFAKRSEFLHTGPTSRVVIADLDNDALPEVIATASNGAVLVLNRSGESCIADYLPDGALDFFDIAAFLADFNQQVPATDLNRDGNFNFFDVAAFMRAFASNCR